MRKRSSGFTLVEIMIVVAIIGILIAIAVPGFIKARTTSQGRSCAENLQKIDGAMEQFALETKLDTGDACGLDDLYEADGSGYIKSEPVCPSGGAYTVTEIGTLPTCDKDDAAGDGLHDIEPAA